MKSVLFNSHDIVLALVIALCFLLAFRVRLESALSRQSRGLLMAFFVLSGLLSLDTLLFWGDAIRVVAFDVSPWLPTLFNFAAFAVGPVFYWAFCSVLQPQKPIAWKQGVQLLPALLTFPYLYWACYRHPTELQSELILNLSVFSDPRAHFMEFLTLKKLMPVVYGSVCIAMLLQRRDTEEKAPDYLYLFLQPYAGFVMIWLWVLATHLLGQWLPLPSSDFMGIFGNYMNLTLVAALVFHSVKQPVIVPAVEHHPPPEEDNAPETLALAERIHKLMLTEKPYLNARLTLERFAALLQTSPRQVSLAINRGFEQNFHEYINGFRVEEAKRLLRDVAFVEDSVLEIAQHSGFNSKATFNRIFKLVAGVTPTEYRRQFSAQLAPSRRHC